MRTLIYVLLWGSLCLSVGASERLPGDINGDGQVDFFDFLLFADNFGKTGGATFDPNAGPDAVVSDTVIVSVTDTITVSEIIMVRDTVRVNPFLGTGNLIPSIGVKHSDKWIHDVWTLSKVMNRTRDLFNESFIAPITSNINVEYHHSQTGLRFERNNGGEYSIIMNLTGNHIQTVHYFAHEYLHILGNHWQTRTGSHTWLEEAMATTAAYFVLRKLNAQLHDEKYQPTWDFDKGLGKIMAEQIGPYMEEFKIFQ